MTAALIVFLVLLFTGIPLYVDLGLSSFLYIFMTGMKPIVVLQRITQAANSFTMIAAPFFILMGNLMNTGGVTRKLFRFANTLVGSVPGGMGHANILCSAMFAGMSGTAVAPAGRRLNYLLSIRPNKRQNAYTFYKYLVSNILLWGNAFVLPVRDVYMNVEELILLDPRYVTLDTINNIYEVTDFVNGIYGKFDAEEILHFKNYCSDNGYWGISTIRYAAVTLGIAATAENETLKRFATGGRFKAVLQNNFTSYGVGEYQDEQLQGHADDLQTAINRGDDLLVVKGDGKLTPISMSSADMQFLESRKLTNRDIARFFNVHQSKLMDDTNSNYKSTEMSNIAFYSETLQPYTSEIEREFCAKLLTEAAYSDHKFVVDTAPIYALDLEAKIKKMEALLRTGQSTVNELRRDNDMEPVENGDVVYLSVNLAPLGSDKLNGSSKPEDGGEDVEALKARIKELENQLNS